MNKKERLLLLKDLSGRLPYLVHYNSDNYDTILVSLDVTLPVKEEFPYLRPLTSITQDEINELRDLGWIYNQGDIFANFQVNIEEALWLIDFLNYHHFDYRGLIEKGLALEAPEGMYNLKT